MLDHPINESLCSLGNGLQSASVGHALVLNTLQIHLTV